MTKKIEFASQEWMDALKAMIQVYMAKAGPDVKLSICEVFTGVPKHLDRNGNGVLSWYCRIADGKLQFEYGEIDDADIKSVCDYDFILPFARMQIGPATAADYEKMQEEGTKTGKLKREGDRNKVPPAFYGMHNDLAAITA
jgi:hypothetical protein